MCDCNESPFAKLRESWSRHFIKPPKGQCDCCCSEPPAPCQTKGRFGVAYIIETPSRKCKPCGWEVEFNDSPSQINTNCKKMMQWITCPPLGECSNHRTNVCCSNAPPEALTAVRQMCCKCASEKQGSGGDCCCRKPVETKCCCARQPERKQCCSKPKAGCCKARNGQQLYLESKNQCSCQGARPAPKCCPCGQRCCSQTSPKCCCESDSQSSLEDCCCQKKRSKKKCPCSKAARGQKQKKAATATATQNTSRTKVDAPQQPSKNFHSPPPKQEKQRASPRSPYTISVPEQLKKGPDKQETFQQELARRIKLLGEAENVKLKEADEAVQQVESPINITDYEHKVEEKQDVSEEKLVPVERDKEPARALPPKRPKRKIKRGALLKMIKEGRRRETEAIHPNLLGKGPQASSPRAPKLPRKRKKIPRKALLKMIKAGRRKELDAIHPQLQ